MIKRLSLSNYRSLGRNVVVDLGALTALVGPNGSGKSNVIDALHFLADCMHIGLESAITKRHGIGAVRRWSSGHPYNVQIKVEIVHPSAVGEYEFVLVGDSAEEYRVKSEIARSIVDGQSLHEFRIENGHWMAGPADLKPKVDPQSLALPLIAGDKRFRRLADELRRIAVYSIFPDELRQPQKYDPAKPMEKHGKNWVSVLKDQDRDFAKAELVDVLRRLTGDIKNLKVVPVGGYLSVQFEHEREPDSKRAKWFDAAQESDGTLRVAGMITALLQTPRPSLIAVEEPELTVHPGALRLINDFVQEASQSCQVVLSTHSPDLLDLLDSEDVRVVERRGGATSVGPLSDHQRNVVRQGLLTLGEVLRAEGLQQRQLPLAGLESES